MPSLALFGQAVSEEKIFLTLANQKKYQCWWPCLWAKWNEMEKLYRGPYIDAYCQVWFHLAKLFQRRRLKYEKFNGRTTAIPHMALWVWWAKKWWKKGNNQIYFKIAGHVDLDKLNMFSVYTQHLSLIVFEIKDEKY